jgi:hypothetical protein
MKYLILLLCSLSLEARFEDWTQKEQELFIDFIALNALDAHMTHRAIQDYEAVEVNPFLGESPSAERLILHKAITTGIIYYLLDKDVNAERERDLKILNGIYLAAVIHNGHVLFEIRKDF